tara:strand:+ start:184 stop:405 length:222 start_codon:yes stop_codon:yes gene_type:complete
MNYAETIMELDKYKESHPNLTSFWNLYINLKKTALEESILECEKSLGCFKTSGDANLTNIMFIYLYLKSISTT